MEAVRWRIGCADGQRNRQKVQVRRFDVGGAAATQATRAHDPTAGSGQCSSFLQRQCDDSHHIAEQNDAR